MATAVVAALLSGGAAYAGPAIPCRAAAEQQLRGNGNGMETVRARTFHIVAEPQKESFKIGSKALVDMTVTRPAHEDPAGLGIENEPPTSVPAENVTVGIGVHVGDVFVPGFGRTDAEGKVTVSIALPRYMKPGVAAMTVYAWNVVHESPCLRVEEDGFAKYPEAFTVTR